MTVAVTVEMVVVVAVIVGTRFVLQGIAAALYILKNVISKPIHFFFFINLSIVFLSIFHSHFNNFPSTSLLYSFFHLF